MLNLNKRPKTDNFRQCMNIGSKSRFRSSGQVPDFWTNAASFLAFLTFIIQPRLVRFYGKKVLQFLGYTFQDFLFFSYKTSFSKIKSCNNNKMVKFSKNLFIFFLRHIFLGFFFHQALAKLFNEYYGFQIFSDTFQFSIQLVCMFVLYINISNKRGSLTV